MKQSHFEAQFGETKKTLESSRAKIKEFLKQPLNEQKDVLSEQDRTRLTRVLQLVERYQPEREIIETSIINKWKSYLESIYRFLPSLKKSQNKDISAHSYLLTEKTVALLRDLRHIDFQLKQEGGFSEEEILNQERPSEVKSRETLDTSITLEYEKKNWGVERICLDGIQNHLPSDSKGEQVWVRCLVNGEWVSLAEAKQKKNEIEAVRFVDDGVGFDVKNLVLLYSTKTEEKESRGQFGEGIKMVAAAALREKLQPEMESQDWRAKPIPKEIKIYDARNKKEETAQQLSFGTEYLDGKPMIGSRTTFWKPSESFIDELMQIEKKVLALRENYRPVFVGSTGEIVDREPGNLFVKGIYVRNEKTLFSYNFEDVETNRDRNYITHGDILRKIEQIIQEIPDKRLIKTLLQKSILEPGAIESKIYDLRTDHPGVWIEAFYEAFGENAVLETDFEIPKVLENQSLNKIKLPHTMMKLLLRVGVKTIKDVTPDFWEETIPTSLTLEYGKDIWDEERILLDAVQNHLPQDSGGSNINLHFKTKDNKWHSFNELPDIQDEEIESVKIYDDGRGYDARLLGLFHTTKEDSESTGKFGEGLKMLCVASLRKEIDITLQSRDWSSKPRVLQEEIDGQQINRLVFDVAHAVKEQRIDDGDHIGFYKGSSTTFSNLTPELLQEFRQINKKVLAIEKPMPLDSTPDGDVLSLDSGMVYVRDLLIPGDHNLLFTYHFPRLEIKNRDRSFVNQQELTPSIAGIWSQVEFPEVIRSFLFKANLEAQKGSGKDKVEFTIDFTPKNIENWKKIFEEIFGKDTAIRDMRSEDYDAMQQNMHVGLELVSFPTAVYKVLEKIGLPTYKSRLKEMTNIEHISDKELAMEEKALIEALSAIDEYLPNNRPSKIKVYERKFPGQKVAAGFSDGINIYLLRETLSIGFAYAANVYIHEKTHHNTKGAQDASSGFRNYLSLALSKLALEQLKKVRPDLVKTES